MAASALALAFSRIETAAWASSGEADIPEPGSPPRYVIPPVDLGGVIDGMAAAGSRSPAAAEVSVGRVPAPAFSYSDARAPDITADLCSLTPRSVFSDSGYPAAVLPPFPHIWRSGTGSFLLT